MSGGEVPAPFGKRPLPRQLVLFGVPTPVGILTAFRARAVGPRRGTVLCVPGFTGSKEDFRLLLPRIADLGWDAIAYSQRGQADSAAPAGVESYTLDLLVEDTVLVAEYVAQGAEPGQGAEPIHLLGHSLGGLVARAAVLRAPATFADLTMLCSGPGGRPGVHQSDADFAAERGLLALWQGGRPIDEVCGELSVDDAFQRDRFVASSLDNYLGLTRILQNAEDTTAALGEIGLPVLVAHGDADDAWPISQQSAMAESLGACYRVIPDSGHSPNVDNPDFTAQLLSDFWMRTTTHHTQYS